MKICDPAAFRFTWKREKDGSGLAITPGQQRDASTRLNSLSFTTTHAGTESLRVVDNLRAAIGEENEGLTERDVEFFARTKKKLTDVVTPAQIRALI